MAARRPAARRPSQHDRARSDLRDTAAAETIAFNKKTGPDFLFKLIRDESKFCSRCGNALDLKRGLFHADDWHLPFCTTCRIELAASMRDKLVKEGFV